MRVWSLTELMHLTRAELFALHHKIAAEFAVLPAANPDRQIALSNLRNIRRVLARPSASPH